MLPPPMLWESFVRRITPVLEELLSQKVVVVADRAAGSRTASCTYLSDIPKIATDVLRQVENDPTLPFAWTLAGWSISVWKPEQTRIDKIVRLVAVDPQGIGHDIASMARTEAP